MARERYKIWFRRYDKNGQPVGSGVHLRGYLSERHAKKVAEKHFGDRTKYSYVVSKTNPYEKQIQTTE